MVEESHPHVGHELGLRVVAPLDRLAFGRNAFFWERQRDGRTTRRNAGAQSKRGGTSDENEVYGTVGIAV